MYFDPKLKGVDYQVLDALIEWNAQHLYGPTYRDLAAAIGSNSTNTIYRALRRLEHAGFIVRETHPSGRLQIGRAVRVVPEVVAR